jgi:hypothetical protein
MLLREKKVLIHKVWSDSLQSERLSNFRNALHFSVNNGSTKRDLRMNSLGHNDNCSLCSICEKLKAMLFA